MPGHTRRNNTCFFLEFRSILSLNITLQSVLFDNTCNESNIDINVFYRQSNLSVLPKVRRRCWLVSDEEILTCMSRLFDIGLKAEPSGCAAMAVILNNRIPNVAGQNFVLLNTGRKVTLSEMSSYIK